MPDPYRHVITVLSTPFGLIEVGWRMVRKNRGSKITCLVCLNSGTGAVACCETKEELVRHILEDHPQLRPFVKLRNYRKMIV